MGIEQGVMQGIGQGKYNLIKQLFNKYYPKEDDSILESLNSEQYEECYYLIILRCCISYDCRYLLKSALYSN